LMEELSTRLIYSSPYLKEGVEVRRVSFYVFHLFSGIFRIEGLESLIFCACRMHKVVKKYGFNRGHVLLKHRLLRG